MQYWVDVDRVPLLDRLEGLGCFWSIHNYKASLLVAPGQEYKIETDVGQARDACVAAMMKLTQRHVRQNFRRASSYIPKTLNPTWLTLKSAKVLLRYRYWVLEIVAVPQDECL